MLAIVDVGRILNKWKSGFCRKVGKQISKVEKPKPENMKTTNRTVLASAVLCPGVNRTMKALQTITPLEPTSFDRIILHLRCLYHDHKYRWHFAGVWRELRPWHRKQSISPAAA
jgi:hypothetical protein